MTLEKMAVLSRPAPAKAAVNKDHNLIPLVNEFADESCAFFVVVFHDEDVKRCHISFPKWRFASLVNCELTYGG